MKDIKTVLAALDKFLEHRAFEKSFECCCDVLSSGGPCAACLLRDALEDRMGPSTKTWLAHLPRRHSGDPIILPAQFRGAN